MRLVISTIGKDEKDLFRLADIFEGVAEMLRMNAQREKYHSVFDCFNLPKSISVNTEINLELADYK